jgi:hypothetical protein
MSKKNTSRGSHPSLQLPLAPWYHRSLYQDVPAWTAQDWVRAIMCRQAVLDSHQRGTCIHKDRASHWESLHRDCIRGNGLCRGTSSDPPAFYGGEFGPVREISGLDEEAALDETRNALADTESAILAIDLRASDQVIKVALATWLKRKRDNVVQRQAVTADDMQRWSNSRVIAYIDIFLWQESTGAILRPVDIQRALFGDGDDPTVLSQREPKKIFEQSTVRDAQLLLSQQYLDRMAYQVGDVGL